MYYGMIDLRKASISRIEKNLTVFILPCLFCPLPIRIRHVDLPTTASAAETSDSARDLATLIGGHHHGGRHLGEPEVCLREGRLFAPRLEAGR